MKSFRGTLGLRDGLWIGWGMGGQSMRNFWEMNGGWVMLMLNGAYNPFSCLSSDANTLTASEPSYVALGDVSEAWSLSVAPGLTFMRSCQSSSFAIHIRGSTHW